MRLQDILDQYGSGKFVGLGAGPYRAGDKIYTVATFGPKTARLFPVEMVDGKLTLANEDEKLCKKSALAYVIEPNEVFNA